MQFVMQFLTELNLLVKCHNITDHHHCFSSKENMIITEHVHK